MENNLQSAKLGILDSNLPEETKLHIENALNYQLFNAELQQTIIKYVEIGERFPYEVMLTSLRNYSTIQQINHRVRTQEKAFTHASSSSSSSSNKQ